MTPASQFSAKSSGLLTRATSFGLRAILVCGLAACSSAASADAIPAADLGHVQEICKTVMGLSPGEIHFDGCVDSLTHTVAVQQGAKRIQGLRETCRAKGLEPGSRDFAVCVLSGS